MNDRHADEPHDPNDVVGHTGWAIVACAVLLFIAARGVPARRTSAALAGLREVLRHPFVRRIAPSWVCVNAVIGLWLGPTLTFLLLEPLPRSGQYLEGLYAHVPDRIGWLLLGYTLLFGLGVSLWSIVLPKLRPRAALASSLIAMLGATFALYGINHSARWSGEARAALLGITVVLVMIESGFTPAALSLLAASLELVSGKGAAMGIYSLLLGLGAVIGSLLAGVLGALWQVDGLLLGTLLMALLALLAVRLVPSQIPQIPLSKPRRRRR
ncbi:MAG: MFS transporter [Steroidobacteraceae bacterium]